MALGFKILLQSAKMSDMLHWLVESQQPLHLFISSDNSKALDDARKLSENLLDTIRGDSSSFRFVSWSLQEFLLCLNDEPIETSSGS